MIAARQLSWDNFRATVLSHGEQRVHRVSSSPFIEIFGDGVRNRVGICVEISKKTELPPDLGRLSAIEAKVYTSGAQRFLELAAIGTALQKQFYHFATAVSERILDEETSPIDAVMAELECFAALLDEKASLSLERQIGLLGELVFLEHLIIKWGPGALDSWIGPSGEPHDFRRADMEFEVKTTISPYRTHTIHGEEQLVPSMHCTLRLISILLGPGGMSGGFSLSDKVDQLKEQLPNSFHSRFLDSLRSVGFRDSDRAQYDRTFSLRKPIGLVKVEPPCPVLTRESMRTVLGESEQRIGAIQYDISVDGLEYLAGSPEFEMLLAG